MVKCVFLVILQSRKMVVTSVTPLSEVIALVKANREAPLPDYVSRVKTLLPQFINQHLDSKQPAHGGSPFTSFLA